jgi:hypothetical protein
MRPAQPASCARHQGYLSIKSKIVHVVSRIGFFGYCEAVRDYGVVLNLEMEPGLFTVMGCYGRCWLDAR